MFWEQIMSPDHFDHYKATIARQGFIQGTLINYVQIGFTKVTQDGIC